MADERKPRRRSRRDLDALAEGAHDATPLGSFVSEMRSMGASDGVEPNRTLTEFVSAPSREPDLVVASTSTPKARTPMIVQLSAFAATTIGKIVLTGGVAAAAVSGAVVVNEIQEPDPIEVVAGGDDSSSTTTSTTTTSTTTTLVPDDDPVSAGSSTHAVLDAGSVTVMVDGSSVRVVSADPTAGWTAEIETDEPGEAQVNFRNGDARVDFRAEIEDGRLRIRIRDRRTDTETESFPNGDDPADDDDRDDDRDDDSDDDSDDSDDRDDDDDRPGSNSGSDRDDDYDDDDDDDDDDADDDDDDDDDE